MKNQETGHLFLNNEDELPESRMVIENGVAWEYSNTEEQESIQTTGPLKYGVLLMVSPLGQETRLHSESTAVITPQADKTDTQNLSMCDGHDATLSKVKLASTLFGASIAGDTPSNHMCHFLFCVNSER